MGNKEYAAVPKIKASNFEIYKNYQVVWDLTAELKETILYILPEIINIQPDNGMAKPYQIKQIRNFIVKYRLTLSQEIAKERKQPIPELKGKLIYA